MSIGELVIRRITLYGPAIQGQKRTVELTDDQIAFLRESVDYSARAFREHDDRPLDQECANQQRLERETMIASIHHALADGAPSIKSPGSLAA
jgi:hypothetical protein